MKRSLKKISKHLVYLTFGAILFTACKKESEALPEPDNNGVVLLRGIESLDLMKQIVNGNWKIHYGYGGFTGKMRYELPNSTFTYSENSIPQFMFQGVQEPKTKIEWQRKASIFGYVTWIMKLESGEEWIPASIRQDTLSLLTSTSEPVTFKMTKISPSN